MLCVLGIFRELKLANASSLIQELGGNPENLYFPRNEIRSKRMNNERKCCKFIWEILTYKNEQVRKDSLINFLYNLLTYEKSQSIKNLLPDVSDQKLISIVNDLLKESQNLLDGIPKNLLLNNTQKRDLLTHNSNKRLDTINEERIKSHAKIRQNNQSPLRLYEDYKKRELNLKKIQETADKEEKKIATIKPEINKLSDKYSEDNKTRVLKYLNIV